MAEATTCSLEYGKKKKSKGGILHARKKDPTVAMDPPETVDFQGQALQLETKILESRTNYNSLHTLLGDMHGNDGVEEKKIIAAVTLYRVFCKLMAQGNLSKHPQISSPEATISRWLNERLQDYESELLLWLRDANVMTQRTALTVIIRLAKEKAFHLDLTEEEIWQKGVFGKLVKTLFEEKIAQEVRAEFVENYVQRYDDVRFYTFACLG